MAPLTYAPGTENVLKSCSVMPVTERLAGSGILTLSLPRARRARVMKTIFLVMVLAFVFTTGMAVTTIISQIVS